MCFLCVGVFYWRISLEYFFFPKKKIWLKFLENTSIHIINWMCYRNVCRTKKSFIEVTKLVWWCYNIGVGGLTCQFWHYKTQKTQISTNQSTGLCVFCANFFFRIRSKVLWPKCLIYLLLKKTCFDVFLCCVVIILFQISVKGGTY